MRYTVAALALTVTLPLLGACGQMGPLYMPPEEAQHGKPAEPAENIPPQTDAP